MESHLKKMHSFFVMSDLLFQFLVQLLLQLLGKLQQFLVQLLLQLLGQLLTLVAQLLLQLLMQSVQLRSLLDPCGDALSAKLHRAAY
jgi:hypothetical protein